MRISAGMVGILLNSCAAEIKEKKERENSNDLHLHLGLLEDSTTRVRMSHGVGRVRIGGHRTAGLFNYKRVITVRRRNR